MELLLSRNELIDLGKNLSGVRIVCIEGCCWLTKAGDNRDHILTQGKAFEILDSGHLVVMALNKCRIRLIDAEKCSSHLLRRIFRPTVSALDWT